MNVRDAGYDPTDIVSSAKPANAAFTAVVIAGGTFFALTLVAMLLYPGGRVGDSGSAGYSFFTNFFSDLGQTHTHSGASNMPSLVLFCLALAAMATGIAVFFVAFVQLLGPNTRGRIAARAAAGCGIVSAIAFIGVAATPWNLYLAAHNTCVTWAFRALLLAVVLDIAAIFSTPAAPRRFGWVFIGFSVLLAAYVVLIAAGPRPNTAEGALVQATGQKIIAYASVLTIVIQAWNARSVRATPARG